MSYPSSVRAAVCYIEAHLRDEPFSYEDMARVLGYSGSYIRELFARHTGCPLTGYVRLRRIQSSAYELLYTDRTVLDIACLYGFAHPETYTRAFRRVTGMTPSTFRRVRPAIGGRELAAGVYGMGLLEDQEKRSSMTMNRKVFKTQDSTVLYGVPQVTWGAWGGCTPYPLCLKACLEYLGEDADYPLVAASSAAAFRLVWNERQWDLSNVDIYHTLNETGEVYALGPQALGREFSFLGRQADTPREAFAAFIREHIDRGYPCIALGVIGPPEPCIITGYRRSGEELLGWSLFQQDPEFAASADRDESGYFVCSRWWENSDTQAVMCVGERRGGRSGPEAILARALQVMEGRREQGYAKGLAAYGAWKRALLEDRDFAATDNLYVLYEKLLCQLDAQHCLTDGRSCAQQYFRSLARSGGGQAPHWGSIADAFARCAHEAERMQQLLGDPQDTEGMLRQLADPAVRRQLCGLIDRARQADGCALQAMTAAAAAR